MVERVSSASGPTRWEAVVSAATTVIESLSAIDYFGVVTFSSLTAANSQKRWKTVLSPGTATEKRAAVQWINDQGPDGQTFFTDGLATAKTLIDNSKAQEKFSNCQTTILFLTDGVPNEASTDPSKNQGFTANDIYTSVQNVISNNTSMFTFSFGNDADTAVTKRMACMGNGIWQPITSSSDLLSQMSSYFKFLASLRGENEPRWSAKYVDASGLGEMVTVSAPIFQGTSSATSLPLLVGVAGVDVTIADVQAKGADEVSFLNYIAVKSQQCSRLVPTTCQLQTLRAAVSQNAVCVSGTDGGTYPTPSSCGLNQETRTSCSASISATSGMCAGPALTDKSYSDVACCPGTGAGVGLIAGAAGGAVGGLILLCAVVYCCCRSKGKKAPPPVSVSSSGPPPEAVAMPAPRSTAYATGGGPPPASYHTPGSSGYPSAPPAPAIPGYPGASAPIAPYPGGAQPTAPPASGFSM
jgi:hypothetical protein